MGAEIKLASRPGRRFTSARIAAIAMVLISSSISGAAGGASHIETSSLIAVNPNTEVIRPTLPLPSTAPVRPTATSKLLRDLGSQTIDQGLHFVIAAGPIWASRTLVGVPWYGWLITPVLAYREWSQWPSKRWWDPPLDWTFLTLGVVWATWGPARRRRVRDKRALSTARS